MKHTHDFDSVFKTLKSRNKNEVFLLDDFSKEYIIDAAEKLVSKFGLSEAASSAKANQY